MPNLTKLQEAIKQNKNIKQKAIILPGWISPGTSQERRYIIQQKFCNELKQERIKQKRSRLDISQISGLAVSIIANAENTGHSGYYTLIRIVEALGKELTLK